MRLAVLRSRSRLLFVIGLCLFYGSAQTVAISPQSAVVMSGIAVQFAADPGLLTSTASLTQLIWYVRTPASTAGIGPCTTLGTITASGLYTPPTTTTACTQTVAVGIGVIPPGAANNSAALASALVTVLPASIAAGSPGPAGPPGAAGAQGPVGPIGPQGPAGTAPFTSIQVSSVPYGTPAAAAIAGGVLTLTIPAGPSGAAGPAGVPGAQGPGGVSGATGPPGPSGPIGATGATGSQGPAGPQGPQGPQGPAGTGTGSTTVVCCRWQGTWTPANNYAQGDVVYYNGSSYIATMASGPGASITTQWVNGVQVPVIIGPLTPGTSGWQIIAAGGLPGPPGPTAVNTIAEHPCAVTSGPNQIGLPASQQGTGPGKWCSDSVTVASDGTMAATAAALSLTGYRPVYEVSCPIAYIIQIADTSFAPDPGVIVSPYTVSDPLSVDAEVFWGPNQIYEIGPTVVPLAPNQFAGFTYVPPDNPNPLATLRVSYVSTDPTCKPAA